MKTMKEQSHVSVETDETLEASGAEKLELTIRRTKKLRSAVKAGPTTSTNWTLAEAQQL